jgi:hypothetical protein
VVVFKATSRGLMLLCSVLRVAFELSMLLQYSTGSTRSSTPVWTTSFVCGIAFFPDPLVIFKTSPAKVKATLCAYPIVSFIMRGSAKPLTVDVIAATASELARVISRSKMGHTHSFGLSLRSLGRASILCSRSLQLLLPLLSGVVEGPSLHSLC